MFLLNGEVIKNSPNRRYLFSVAAQAMRRILVDHGRARLAEARAGLTTRVMLDDVLEQMEGDGLPILELNEAI